VSVRLMDGQKSTWMPSHTTPTATSLAPRRASETPLSCLPQSLAAEASCRHGNDSPDSIYWRESFNSTWRSREAQVIALSRWWCGAHTTGVLS